MGTGATGVGTGATGLGTRAIGLGKGEKGDCYLDMELMYFTKWLLFQGHTSQSPLYNSAQTSKRSWQDPYSSSPMLSAPSRAHLADHRFAGAWHRQEAIVHHALSCRIEMHYFCLMSLPSHIGPLWLTPCTFTAQSSYRRKLAPSLPQRQCATLVKTLPCSPCAVVRRAQEKHW